MKPILIYECSFSDYLLRVKPTQLCVFLVLNVISVIILWHSSKGGDAICPPPYFVFFILLPSNHLNHLHTLRESRLVYLHLIVGKLPRRDGGGGFALDLDEIEEFVCRR